MGGATARPGIPWVCVTGSVAVIGDVWLPGAIAVPVCVPMVVLGAGWTRLRTASSPWFADWRLYRLAHEVGAESPQTACAQRPSPPWYRLARRGHKPAPLARCESPAVGAPVRELGVTVFGAPTCCGVGDK